MTRNQIYYWELVEKKRSNNANELLKERELSELERSNIAKENETARHNVAYEDETHRHNVATESEQERSHRANELITSDQVQESKRHNAAQEAINRQLADETGRHNMVSENIQWKNAAIEEYRAGEQARHNQVAESQNMLDVTNRYRETDALVDLRRADTNLKQAQAETERRKPSNVEADTIQKRAAAEERYASATYTKGKESREAGRYGVQYANDIADTYQKFTRGTSDIIKSSSELLRRFSPIYSLIQ